MHFNGENISQDNRTLKLLQLAIRNMVSVQTLRVIFGHYNITKGLLEGFLDPDRVRRIPLRKLWLESCSFLFAKIEIRPSVDMSGLESVRIRRLRAEDLSIPGSYTMPRMTFRLSRGAHILSLHNGAGGLYHTTIEFDEHNPPSRLRLISRNEMSIKAKAYDELTWNNLQEIGSFVEQAELSVTTREKCAPQLPLIHLLKISSSTLTSLNLDWILWRADSETASMDNQLVNNTIIQLSKLRFRNLRAFQVRNAVVETTRLPVGLYLLEPGDFVAPLFLDFLEAHPKIQCLAWPMDRFYSHSKPHINIRSRCSRLVAHLGQMLVDLRIDSYYNHHGEGFTDVGTYPSQKNARIRRRRFIAEFAPFMRKVKQIKMEGGIPRDEKREVLRALHHCPLQKIVLIGVSCPIGNTWGHQAEDLKEIDEGNHDFRGILEEEDKEAIWNTYNTTPLVPDDYEFTPSYGWPPSPPLIHTIAAHHASTVTELKFCGYNGSPVLTNGTSITKPLLWPLRHFHNLRQLVISMWLFTYYDFEDRDEEIIASWVSARSPSSTALVVVTPAGSSRNSSPSPSPPVAPTIAPQTPNPHATSRQQDFNRWSVILKTQFSPSALAYRVAADIGPHLSPIAKEREGGVRVRASFCLGTSTGDIFDLDLRVGKDNALLEFVGPREEGEKNRWWDKLEGRRWF